MRWSKMKRLLKRRPFVLNTDALSYREAKDIFMQGFPTFEEMVTAAKRKSSLPDSAWDPFDRAIAARKRKAEFWGLLFTPVHFLRLHARTVVVTCCLTLILLFFTLIPIGRAWAEVAYRYVLRVFENIIYVLDPASEEAEFGDAHGQLRSTSLDESGSINQSQYGDDYWERQCASIDEFTKDTGRTPIVLPEYVATPASIRFVHDVMCSDMLIVMYTTAAGSSICIRQEWSISTPSISYVSDETWIRTTILNGTLLIGNIDPVNNTFSGYALLNDDSVLSVGCEDPEEVNTILEALYLYE